jgi:hypothetical protein
VRLVDWITGEWISGEAGHDLCEARYGKRSSESSVRSVPVDAPRVGIPEPLKLGVDDGRLLFSGRSIF